LASPGERRRLFGYLEERFGIPPSRFDDFVLFQRGDGWYLLKSSRHLGTARTLKVSKPGLRAFRSINAFVKPSTRFIQIFGHTATQCKMELSETQLADLLEGKDIRSGLGDMPTGYLILTFDGGRILGLGFYRNGRVKSQLPRKETASVRFLSY
jgi:NOL1/NOP2/fmu family ribosome biogenesis protein